MPRDHMHGVPEELDDLMMVISAKDWILLVAISLIFALAIGWYLFGNSSVKANGDEVGPVACVTPERACWKDGRVRY